MTDHSRLTDSIFTGIVSRFGVPLRSKSAGEIVFNYWKTANRVAQEVIFLEAAEEAEKQNAAYKVAEAAVEQREDSYGGVAGGGKSDALLAGALQEVDEKQTDAVPEEVLDPAVAPPGDSLEERAPRTVDKTVDSADSQVLPGGLVEPQEVGVETVSQDVVQIRADQAVAKAARKKEAASRAH